MSSCPDELVLRKFENGELTDAVSEPIEGHVARCPTCRSMLERLRTADVGTQRLRDVFRKVAGGSLTHALEPLDLDHANGSDQVGGDASERRTNGSTRLSPAAAVDSSGESLDTSAATFQSRDFTAAGWAIPDYERVVLCGEGSYGSVWAVRDRVGVYRALKLIDLARIGRAKAGQRERTALETYCRTIHRHPYLVTVYHVGIVGNLLYYTMELADDQSSRGMVRDRFPPHYRPLTLDPIIRGRRLHVDVAMELARRLLRGLSKLHSLDLVHRDIKPTNVIFVNRQPKLADIGMISTETESGPVIGTPDYMPPDKKMNKTADTYAFGKMLHQMLAGRDASCFPELPPERRAGSTRWDMMRLNDLLVRACAPQAEDRYQTAAAMLEDLEACAALAFDSLFEEELEVHADAPHHRGRAGNADMTHDRPQESLSDRAESAAIVVACLRIIPWILGFVAVMFAISHFARWLRGG